MGDRQTSRAASLLGAVDRQITRVASSRPLRTRGILMVVLVLAILVWLLPDKPSSDVSSAETSAATATAAVEPTATTPVATATAGGIPSISAPTIAPDGRTPDPGLNALIESLLTDDAAALEQRYGALEAREHDKRTGENHVWPSGVWTARLATGERSLYAVAPAHPQASPQHDVDVVLAVGTGDVREGWRFAIAGAKVVDLTILDQPMGSVSGPYDQFLVLPPLADLPQPPAAYAFASGVPRTGVAGVDALVDALASHDVAALTAAVAYTRGTLPEQHCNIPQALDATDIVSRLDRIATQAYSLRAVANVPNGYLPAADHLLVVVLQTAPYRWTQSGLLEANGRIVGLLTECVSYPPRAFLVSPPPDGVDTIDPARRSGIATVDAVLDALAVKDRTALTATIDFSEVRCVTEPSGIGSPPVCSTGEAAGTPMAVLPSAGCEGHYVRRDELGGLFDFLLAANWRLYAVVDRGAVAAAGGAFFGGHIAAVFVPAETDAQHGALLLYFTDRGISTIQTGCGQDPPETQLARAGSGSDPDLLLAPPPAAPASPPLLPPAPKTAPDLPGDVQAAISAALAHHRDRLGALLTPTEGPCVVAPPPDLLRAPSCPSGMAADTPVPALVVGGCPDRAGFIDPAITYRVTDFDTTMFANRQIGVVELAEGAVPCAVLFGFEKVGWLGFDTGGHLIGAGGGGDCAAADLQPRLAGAAWLQGPDWGE